MTKTALIVTDYQNDFVEGGKLAVAGGIRLGEPINDYIKRGDHDLRVASQDAHLGDTPALTRHFAEFGDHCTTPKGIDFAPNFNRKYVEHIVKKGHDSADPSPFDGFVKDGRSLWEVLHDEHIDTIEICGIAAEVCVLSGLMDSLKLGYKTTLLVGLTAAINGDEGMRDVVKKALDAGAYIR